MRRRTFLRVTLAAVSLAMSAASLALRAVVAQVPAVRPRQRTMRLPPLPKWKKTTDDIDSNDFVRRAQDYERSHSLFPGALLIASLGIHAHGETLVSAPILYYGMCDASAGVALTDKLFAVAIDAESVLRVYDRGQAVAPATSINLSAFH